MTKVIPNDSGEAIDILQDVLKTLDSHKVQKTNSPQELIELLDFTDEDIADALFNNIDWNSLHD